MKLFSTAEAAEYLGLSVVTVRYHIDHGNLTPTKVGHSLVFTQAQLDDFNASKRPAHRPRKEERTDSE
jgi:excisionase family DNA binding protein